MKKKALICLSLVPFVVGVLAFVTSSFVIRNVEQDVNDIAWDYEQNTPFEMANGMQKLNATAIFDDTYPLAEGNELIWESEDPQIADILVKDDGTYLVPKKEGRVTISCFNKKKTVKKSFTAVIIGSNGAIIINPIIPFSQKTITGIDYVGAYDSIKGYDAKTIDAKLELNVEVYGGSLSKDVILIESSDNLKYDKLSETVSITGIGKSYIEFNNPYSDVGDARLDFEVVEALNVYDYEDLINSTNKTSNSYDLVLRRNLESLTNAYEMDTSNLPLNLKHDDTELFGRLENKKIKSFKDDVYSFETTYNHDFLNSWNKAVENGTLSEKHTTTTNVMSGIHLKGDMYGNGFVINTHELVYPSQTKEINVNGQKIIIASLGDDDLFRGPLKFVSLGDPYSDAGSIKPIFSLDGQDNSSFYIDKDNVTLNDVHFKGADFGTNLTNLQYSGSVLDINADNVTIKNSIIENGRNVIRAYSSNNLNISNSIIRNGMEFNFRSGANEFNHVNYDRDMVYATSTGPAVTSVRKYLQPSANPLVMEKDYKADSILTNSAIYGTQANEFVGSELLDYTKDDYIKGRAAVVSALTNIENILDKEGNKTYKGNTIMDKVFFGHSGISSISMDSLPQGSFLENNITSLFRLILGIYIDLMPTDLALTGYPTKLEIKGDTRFYDWKNKDDLTYQSLIEQDIKTLIMVHGGLGEGFDVNITEDDYLPIKKLLLDNHSDILLKDNKLNLPIYYQGGGANMSDVIIDDSIVSSFNEACELDPFKYSLDLKADPVEDFNRSPIAKYQAMKIAMLRAASNVMGFNTTKIIALNNKTAKWYNESINMDDIRLY